MSLNESWGRTGWKLLPSAKFIPKIESILGADYKTHALGQQWMHDIFFIHEMYSFSGNFFYIYFGYV